MAKPDDVESCLDEIYSPLVEDPGVDVHYVLTSTPHSGCLAGHRGFSTIPLERIGQLLSRVEKCSLPCTQVYLGSSRFVNEVRSSRPRIDPDVSMGDMRDVFCCTDITDNMSRTMSVEGELFRSLVTETNTLYRMRIATLLTCLYVRMELGRSAFRLQCYLHRVGVLMSVGLDLSDEETDPSPRGVSTPDLEYAWAFVIGEVLFARRVFGSACYRFPDPSYDSDYMMWRQFGHRVFGQESGPEAYKCVADEEARLRSVGLRAVHDYVEADRLMALEWRSKFHEVQWEAGVAAVRDHVPIDAEFVKLAKGLLPQMTSEQVHDHEFRMYKWAVSVAERMPAQGHVVPPFVFDIIRRYLDEHVLGIDPATNY